MEKIDKLDRKILKMITRNARVPSKEVAEACGVSRAAIHQRINRLVDMDILTGSSYNANPRALGFNISAMIGVKLERGSLYHNVVPELFKIQEVTECHYTTGPYAIMIKLYARDQEHLMRLLNDRIQAIPGVTSTDTFLSLEQPISRQVPIYEN